MTGALLLAAMAQAPALAASAVTVLPATQKPTKVVTVAGTGFAANEAVDVYLDSTDTLLLVSTASGTFSGALTLPAATLPGPHYATAIGRHSGDAAQLAFTVSTPWNKFSYGANNGGVNPLENVLSTSSVPSLGVAWSHTPAADGGTPAVVAGRVFVPTSTGVIAYVASTGTVAWTANLGVSFVASPTVVDNRLYIGDFSSNFYALNTANGAVIWKVKLAGYFYGSAVVSNNIIYVGSYDGNFYALNAKTGAVLWSYALPSGTDDSAAVSNGLVYFGGYGDDKVYCLNATTGALVWSYTTGGAVESSPVVVNGALYIGSDDSTIYALGTSSSNAGTLIWSYKTGGKVYATPIVYNNHVYVGSADGMLYALNVRDGSVYFTLVTNGLVRSASAANGVIYFTSQDENFYAITTYGGVLVNANVGYSFFGAPAISDGAVYLATDSGDVYAFAPNAGNDAVAAAKAPNPAFLRRDMSLRITR